jgi:hypothetical protein
MLARIMRPMRALFVQQGSGSSKTAGARWPPPVFNALTADGHDVALSGLFDDEPWTEGMLCRNHLATGGIGTGGREGGVFVWTCHCLLASDMAFLQAMCFSLTLLHFDSSRSFLLAILLGDRPGDCQHPIFVRARGLVCVSPRASLRSVLICCHSWCRFRARRTLPICLEGQDEKPCT